MRLIVLIAVMVSLMLIIEGPTEVDGFKKIGRKIKKGLKKVGKVIEKGAKKLLENGITYRKSF